MTGDRRFETAEVLDKVEPAPGMAQENHRTQAFLARIADMSGAQQAQLWHEENLAAEVIAAGAAVAWREAPIAVEGQPWGRLRLGFAPADQPLADDATRDAVTRLAATAMGLEQAMQRLHQQWEQVRAASFDMLTINEEEFGRIILDIHDGPVQNMFAALSQVNLLQSQLAQHSASLTAADATELQKRLPRVSLLLESSLTEIRNFIGAFRPPEFARRWLPAVVEGLIIQHEELTGSTVDLEVEEPLPMVPLPIKIAVYRILQEALFNAHKHAGVNRHFVRLHMDKGCLCLTVADQGTGFDAQATLAAETENRTGHHIGLRGMRDRVRMVGGAFMIHSVPGQGTRIQVRIPLYEH